jgi:hypothetical protein
MHYVGTRTPRATHSPLRSIPMFQPASTLRQIQPLVQHPAPPVTVRPTGHACHVPDARELAQTALANAQAGLREAVRVYDFARREIGQANRGVFAGHAIKNITPERRRALRRAAFLLFNKRRGQLVQARRRVAAAELALAATAQADLSAAA